MLKFQENQPKVKQEIPTATDNRCSDMFRNAFRRVLSHSAPRYLPGVLGSVGSIIEQEGHKIMENQQKGQSWPVSQGDV